MLDVGDWRIPTLAIDPADATTSASYVVVAPDGTAAAPVTATVALNATAGTGTATGTGYELTVAGEWVERWTVTGTGQSKERAIVLVAPDPVTAPSGGRVYATTTDLANWLQAAPPAGSRKMLRAASRQIDKMLLTATYDVDSVTLLPTDTVVITAFRDAVCAVIEEGKRNGEQAYGGAGSVASFTIGGITVNRAGNSGQPVTVEGTYPDAAAILAEIPADKICWEPWGY